MSQDACRDIRRAGSFPGRWRFAAGLATLALLAAACGEQAAPGEAPTVEVRFVEVHLFNGLDLPVVVSLADREIQLAPAQVKALELPAGPMKLVARRDTGTVLEELDVVVPDDANVVAYNVLGAAPLVFEKIQHTKPLPGLQQDDGEISAASLAGSSWVIRRNIDHVFQEADSDLLHSLDETAATHTRTRVSMGNGGWRAAVAHLAADERLEEAASLARRVARLTPSDAAAVRFAYSYSAKVGDAAVERTFLEEILRAVPESTEAHRLYQDHMESHGELAEILPRYEAAWRAEPDAARQGYLYARISPFATALPIYGKLVPMYPEDAWLRRGAAWAYFQSGRFAEALPHYRKLAALEPGGRGAHVRNLARILVAEGGSKDALAVVGEIFDGAAQRRAQDQEPFAGADPWMLTRLYARLVRSAPSSEHPPTLEQRWRQVLDGDDAAQGLLAMTAARARDVEALRVFRPRIDDAKLGRYLDLTVQSQSDVEAAAQLALTDEAMWLEDLDVEVKLALVCELARLGHRAEAQSLLEGLQPQIAAELDMAHIDALPDVSGLPEAIDIELRAVLLYAASRRTDDDSLRSALLERARKFDILGVVVPE